jgi:hypothetical protein
MMIAQKRMVAALTVAAICAFAFAGPAGATPVVLAGPDSWNSWGAAAMTLSAARAAGPFWDNASYDRNGLANIGYFLSNTPGSDVPGFYDYSPGAYLPYLGDGSTTFALVLDDSSQPTDFTHLLSVTGWKWPADSFTDDELGLYNLASGERYALFSASGPLGMTVGFYPTGTYAFYLTSGEGRTWYSTELDGGRNHFALFQGENQWYLGVEDATYTTTKPADWDYNDMVVRWAEPVPEVGSMSMLGLALLSLGAARRRWLK